MAQSQGIKQGWWHKVFPRSKVLIILKPLVQWFQELGTLSSQAIYLQWVLNLQHQTPVYLSNSVFKLKDIGRLTYFLSLQINYKSNGDICVNQSKYVKDLLHKAGMDSCKSASTPCKPYNSLLLTEGEPLSDPSLYRTIVGSLQYLTFTRPDIAYAINTVCQFMAKPTEVHFGAVKRILRFLKGTMQHGITFSANTEVRINAFSDADWDADLNTRRSITGYVIYIDCNPVS
nr:uncharacterized protein LOC114820882 [Malus domestica]